MPQDLIILVREISSVSIKFLFSLKLSQKIASFRNVSILNYPNLLVCQDFLMWLCLMLNDKHLMVLADYFKIRFFYFLFTIYIIIKINNVARGRIWKLWSIVLAISSTWLTMTMMMMIVLSAVTHRYLPLKMNDLSWMVLYPGTWRQRYGTLPNDLARRSLFW